MNVPNLVGLPTPYCYYQGVLAYQPSVIVSYKHNTLSIQHHSKSFTLNLDAHQALSFLSDFNQNLKNKANQFGLIGFFSFEFGLKLLNYFFAPTEYLINGEKHQVSDEKIVRETPNQKLLNQDPFPTELTSNLTQKEYTKQFQKIQEYLKKGETYQVNFAQEFNIQTKLSAEEIFSKLHQSNPSPHEAILKTANFSIISNSPESLYQKQDDTIETFPIKGTARKSSNPEQDQENIQNLLKDPKETAELEMIVDLERNDLGRLALAGSVQIKKHRYIETYKNLHHTISQITAQLPNTIQNDQIIEALFPGGSITGCPKKRTSKIIHQLEPTPRGSYCGSLGYFTTQNDSKFNILIRTIWLENNNASFHSGGGITINSTAKNEYQETLTKAKTISNILTP